MQAHKPHTALAAAPLLIDCETSVRGFEERILNYSINIATDGSGDLDLKLVITFGLYYTHAGDCNGALNGRMLWSMCRPEFANSLLPFRKE